MLLENTPTIVTKRLILRRFTMQDLSALFGILQNEEVNTFLPWFPLKTIGEAEQFLQNQFLSWYEKPSAYRYAICLQENNIPIGYVTLSEGASYDVGFGVSNLYWHKGLVSEAVLAVVERIRQAGYLYITATHDVKNPHSGSVMRKIGMCYQYSYIEQWQPKNLSVTFRMYQLNLDGNPHRVYEGYRKRYSNHFIEEF